MFGKLLLTGILALGCAAAQDGMGGGGMGGRGGGGGGMRGGGDMGAPMSASPRRANKLEQISDKLKLNKEQKEEFSKILSATAERAGSVRLELDKARADLAGALIDGKPADEVAKLTAGIGAASAKMTKIEADAFGKICAMLKPNQTAKAGQAFELMASLFTGPPRAGGAGRGGMGGGSGRSRGAGR